MERRNEEETDAPNNGFTLPTKKNQTMHEENEVIRKLKQLCVGFEALGRREGIGYLGCSRTNDSPLFVFT
jgi:hypothetical protein